MFVVEPAAALVCLTLSSVVFPYTVIAAFCYMFNLFSFSIVLILWFQNVFSFFSVWADNCEVPLFLYPEKV
jgi:hypothetical protein